ncbi:MAG: NAD(P)-dependent oxidoreductase [Alphaproteobacteria bacterium]|nr:NAD(P)-dependent oxidoreductase [Alphaproteobacteria bacterium]
MKIGVIGVGNMGMNIARRLIAKGYAVHTRDVRPEADAEARSIGAKVEPSAAALARAVDVVVIIVLNAQQIDDVLTGPHGALSALRSGQIVLLSSTIAPTDTIRYAELLSARGVACLDAPVSGGPVRAREGTMSLMWAGNPDSFTRIAPLIADMAGKVFRISDRPGDAAKAKLVNNLLAGTNLVAGAAAIALAERVGLDPKVVFDLICGSSGTSWVFADRMTRALEDDYVPRSFAHILTKDMTLATEMARAAGFATPAGDYALDIFKATCAAGLAEEDDASVFKVLRKS